MPAGSVVAVPRIPPVASHAIAMNLCDRRSEFLSFDLSYLGRLLLCGKFLVGCAQRSRVHKATGLQPLHMAR